MSLGVLERFEQRITDLETEVADLKARATTVAPAPSSDELLTIAQVAEIRRCSVAALHKAVQRGRLSVVRRGRSVLVRRGDL